MKKFLIALVVLVAVIALAIYLVIGNLDTIVKKAVEHFGSQVTQTAVRVQKVHIDLAKGSGGIYGLTIANPKGYKSKSALSLGEASIKFDLKALSKDLNAKRQGNLNQLYSNVGKSIPAGEDQSTSDQEAGPRLIIRKLDFKGGSINALVVPLDNKTYPANLPAIHMTNLGAPKGATGSKIAKEVLSRLIKTARDEVQRQVMDRYVNKELSKLKSQVNSRVESEKNKAEQSIKEQADQKLKDLLKR